MNKRTLLIGAYDTAANGWTLSECVLSDAEQKTKYVEKNGGDGSWDLSTAVTDGIPRYKDRNFYARLECSKGTRTERTQLISSLFNLLDGIAWHLVLPDYPDHYLVGRVHIALDYHETAHSSVTVTAVCEPWLYKAQEKALAFELSEDERTATLSNDGRKAIVPVLKVEGNALLKYGTTSLSLTDAGEYEWPTLLLTPGIQSLTYSGEGTLTVTYREAVLR